MNPDVFITIVFVGIALLALLSGIVFAVPRARREGAEVQERESIGPTRESPDSARRTEHSSGEVGFDATVH